MQNKQALFSDYSEDPVPEDFVHRSQWPEYNIAAEFPPETKAAVIGRDPMGVQWEAWPFTFERYVSDKEPTVHRLGAWTIIQWERITRTDIPKGWWQPTSHSYRREAYIQLDPGTPYWSGWSASVRRYRNRWRKYLLESRYQVETIGFPEFKEAYEMSIVASRIGMAEFEIFERKWNNPLFQPLFQLNIAREVSTNKIAGGMAVFDCPTYNSAYYQLGFVHPLFSKENVMVGLMDHWVERAHTRGFRFLALGGLWKRGNPLGEQGYTQFKLHFAPVKLSFPPMLWRIGRFL